MSGWMGVLQTQLLQNIIVAIVEDVTMGPGVRCLPEWRWLISSNHERGGRRLHDQSEEQCRKRYGSVFYATLLLDRSGHRCTIQHIQLGKWSGTKLLEPQDGRRTKRTVLWNQGGCLGGGSLQFIIPIHMWKGIQLREIYQQTDVVLKLTSQ